GAMRESGATNVASNRATSDRELLRSAAVIALRSQLQVTPWQPFGQVWLAMRVKIKAGSKCGSLDFANLDGGSVSQRYSCPGRCSLVLTLVPLPQAPPVELVQSLFDLTPAQARVARSLASGKTVDDIAAESSVSQNTIRTHVRGVLEKTGLGSAA